MRIGVGVEFSRPIDGDENTTDGPDGQLIKPMEYLGPEMTADMVKDPSKAASVQLKHGMVLRPRQGRSNRDEGGQ